MMRKIALILCLSSLAGIAAGHACAAPRITAAQAVAKAQERFTGELLDVELEEAEEDEPGDEVYEVKLITQSGVVIRVRIAAQTGAFLEAAGDNLIPAIRKP